MQDSYVGDIGDFGKYGLLRNICRTDLTLAINWYKVSPKSFQKQNDGKYTDYLYQPDRYRHYDSTLFDTLQTIVLTESRRTIQKIETSDLLHATFFNQDILSHRNAWHQEALRKTEHADIVFLDPDNGLETEKMHVNGKTTEKHVKWNELKDYYDRGQSVILYQHRPQMMKKDVCIKSVLAFNDCYLLSDAVYILAFPKYTNRFYFFFTHEKHSATVKQVCDLMETAWKGICHPIENFIQDSTAI